MKNYEKFGQELKTVLHEKRMTVSMKTLQEVKGKNITFLEIS